MGRRRDRRRAGRRACTTLAVGRGFFQDSWGLWVPLVVSVRIGSNESRPDPVMLADRAATSADGRRFGGFLRRLGSFGPRPRPLGAARIRGKWPGLRWTTTRRLQFAINLAFSWSMRPWEYVPHRSSRTGAADAERHWHRRGHLVRRDRASRAAGHLRHRSDATGRRISAPSMRHPAAHICVAMRHHTPPRAARAAHANAGSEPDDEGSQRVPWRDHRRGPLAAEQTATALTSSITSHRNSIKRPPLKIARRTGNAFL
jgi:hypothetical protein